MFERSRPSFGVAVFAALILRGASAACPPAQLAPLVQGFTQPVTESDSWFGHSLSTGDVNGDGFADVVVGAPFFNGGGLVNAGGVYVFLGPALTPSFSLSEPLPEPNAWFGSSVSCGDVDGDGYDDVVVGAPFANPGGLFAAGEVFVFSGPVLTSVVSLAEPVPEASGLFGTSTAAGDVNGDGLADVVVGAPHNSGMGIPTPGKAFAFLGPALASVLPLTNPSPCTLSGFGRHVATGDVDGDGFSDVLVAPTSGGACTPGSGENGAFVFLGPGLASGLSVIESTGLWMGPFSTGDVNGDGFADVVAGTNDPYLPPFWSGEVRVYLGPALASFLSATEPVPEANARFGSALSTGDVNGDGFDDVLAGAFQATSGGLFYQAGEAFACLGPDLATVLPLLDPSPEYNAQFGYAVAAGDVNGDGAAEAVVGKRLADPGGAGDAGQAFLFVPQFDLGLAALALSASAGGTITFSLDAGSANAGRAFVLAGSATGTSPCLPIGSVCLPILVDPVTLALLQPSTAAFFVGTLDGTGRATRSLPVGPGVFPSSAVGLRLFWAYLLFPPIDYASKPVVFEIVP